MPQLVSLDSLSMTFQGWSVTLDDIQISFTHLPDVPQKNAFFKPVYLSLLILLRKCMRYYQRCHYLLLAVQVQTWLWSGNIQTLYLYDICYIFHLLLSSSVVALAGLEVYSNCKCLGHSLGGIDTL